MTKAEQARQAALERVGDAYVYGAWDQRCTVANRNKYANLKPEYKEKIKKQCQWQSGKKNSCAGCRYEGRRIHDCRGLTNACAAVAGISAITGQTVARQWNADVWAEKGQIATLPNDLPYVQLFRYNGSKWAHTGCYIGNGETVDARGHAQGVIRGKLSAYPWTHWAIPRGMYESPEESGSASGGEAYPTTGSAGGPPFPAEPGRADAEKGESWSVTEYPAAVKVSSGRLNMRSGPGTEHSIVERLPNGTPLVVIAEFDTDGDGNADWAFVDEDGVQGYVSTAYIERATYPTADAVPPSPQSWEGQETEGPPSPQLAGEMSPAGDRGALGVWIPCDSEEEARRYAGNIKGAVLIRYDKPPGEPGGKGE